MGLLSSFFSRSAAVDDGAIAADADPGDSVARARRRARQRLLGAVVLVGIGVIGFPLLFETQPRPVPVDVPIEIPAKDNVAPLTLPVARTAEPKPQAAEPTLDNAKPAPMITETAAEAGLGEAPVAVKPEPAEPREKAVPAKAEARATPVEAPSVPSEAARARALLEGKAAPKEAAGSARYIVQIGAFADPALARATRLKVERLGLETYTHVAKTPGGERTRVRVGPIASREEADKVAAKIKAAGLPTAVLTL